MANESWVWAATKINPVVAQGDVAVVGSGGTLTGSNLIELKVLKANFTSTSGGEGKERLLNALEAIRAKIIAGDWPAA